MLPRLFRRRFEMKKIIMFLSIIAFCLMPVMASGAQKVQPPLVAAPATFAGPTVVSLAPDLKTDLAKAIETVFTDFKAFMIVVTIASVLLFFIALCLARIAFPQKIVGQLLSTVDEKPKRRTRRNKPIEEAVAKPKSARKKKAREAESEIAAAPKTRKRKARDEGPGTATAPA
jgi:hypothetical protein